MHGWFGKILRGDWSSGKIKAETLDPTVARNYIGAWGFGIYYRRNEVDPAGEKRVLFAVIMNDRNRAAGLEPGRRAVGGEAQTTRPALAARSLCSFGRDFLRPSN